MAESFHSHVRLNNADRSKLLSRLDGQPESQSGRERRRHKRYEFRVSDIAVLVQHPGGGTGRYLVCARNISAGGVSFIHGGYLHPGSECRILLPRRDGSLSAVSGLVVHCRHVQAAYHEVGVRFTQDIDPKSLLQEAAGDEDEITPALELPALEGKVLVVDPSRSDRRLMTHQLGVTGLSMTMVETPAAAIEAIRKRGYDVVVCDLNLEEDVVRMIRQMRKAEFKGPIIIATAENSPTRLADARAAGANEIIGKPCNPLYLATLLAEWLQAPPMDRPVYSTLETSPGMAELITDFIDETRTIAHQIGKAMEKNELPKARDLCRSLAGSGTGYGFDALSVAARDAVLAIDMGKAPQDADGALRRVLALCDRLRCGTSVRPPRVK